jgi:hypothetical protein
LVWILLRSPFRHCKQNKRTRILQCVYAGVWLSFSRHSPNWRVVKKFYSPSQKKTGQKYRQESVRGEK